MGSLGGGCGLGCGAEELKRDGTDMLTEFPHANTHVTIGAWAEGFWDGACSALQNPPVWIPTQLLARRIGV